MKPSLRIACSLAAFGATLLVATSSHAWLFHEHARIGRRAVERLSAARRGVLDDAWAELRKSPEIEPRLCAAASHKASGRLVGMPGWCVDFPMFAAIAGDFSCSPEELAGAVARGAWLSEVVQAAYDTEGLIGAATSADGVVAAWHQNHVHNFLADPDYLSRAATNLSHFLLLRVPDDRDLVTAYLQRSLLKGQQPNAAAFYALYHTAALRLADKRHRRPEDAAAGERARLLRTALFAEAFSLHFLEDAFASGHAVGATGDTHERAGTHDYYCEHGIEARPWSDWTENKLASRSYLAHGDAFLRKEDTEHAARAVQASLEDFLGALENGLSAEDGGRPEITAPELDYTERVGAPAMNVCKLTRVPAGLSRLHGDVPLVRTLFRTYMPALGHSKDRTDPFEATESFAELARKAAETGQTPPLLAEPLALTAALPRFHAMMGPFLGVFASARYGFVQPFELPDHTPRFFSAIEAGLDVGLGLDGITTTTADALLFLQVGLVSESAQLDAPLFGAPRIPDRTGFVVRARLPFYAIPGDLLVAAMLYPVLPAQSRAWIARAAQYGLFGLEQPRFTPVGALQLVLGRELSVRYLASHAGRVAQAWELEIPIIEFRPRRLLPQDWSAAFTYQAGVSMDLGGTSRSIGGFLRIAAAARSYPAL